MLHNNGIEYNNIPYNNIYYRTAPIYSNINTNHIDENDRKNDTPDIFEHDDNTRTQEPAEESTSSNKSGLSLFGLSLNIDDIIIVGIVFFLFMENKKDYLLIIILCLLLLDISLDTFKNMNVFKHLFNPS